MADEKLHPEVEALIAKLSADETERLTMNTEMMVSFCNALSAVALLAASKAREEQREVDAGIAFVNRHWDAVRIAAAIRRGKPQ